MELFKQLPHLDVVRPEDVTTSLTGESITATAILRCLDCDACFTSLLDPVARCLLANRALTDCREVLNAGMLAKIKIRQASVHIPFTDIDVQLNTTIGEVVVTPNMPGADQNVPFKCPLKRIERSVNGRAGYENLKAIRELQRDEPYSLVSPADPIF